MLAESFHWSICSDMANPLRFLAQHLPGVTCELAAAAVVILEASAPMSFACVQQKHLWSSGYDVNLTR